MLTFATMLQQAIIVVLFMAALGYLGRMLYRSFQSKSCASGCGKCGAIDFKKIEADLKSKGL